MLNKSCLPLTHCEMQNECDHYRRAKSPVTHVPISAIACKEFVRKPTCIQASRDFTERQLKRMGCCK